MSNSLAVAMVTATITRLLRNAIQAEFSTTFNVSTGRPHRNGEEAQAGEITGSGATVNLFLYQVNPNLSWRNNDLPTRTSSGQLMQRPVAAIDLHYLLTFYGDDDALEPQRLLGITVSALHTTPVLTREMITATKASLAGGDLALLAASDLDEQIDVVRLTPHCFDLDQMSKLWSIFSQNAYALSVAYLASVVLIEAPITPQVVLPVREGLVYATIFKHPYIETVRSESGGAIIAGSRVVITGSNLRSDLTRVRIGSTEIEPLAVSDTLVTFAIPYLGVRAGVQPVQVTHPLMLGDPPTQRPGAESNAAAFVVAPTITGTNLREPPPDPRTLSVGVIPAVGKRQKVRLLLVQAATSQSFQLEALPPADPNVPQATVDFDVTGLPAGTYLIRVQVDGAQSLLESDASGNFISPTVTL